MRILVHDYSGHPFQVQLSRALAARGHEVMHVFSASFQTPKGKLTRQQGDPAGFEIRPVSVTGIFHKDKFLRRRAQEIEIGRQVAAALARFSPEVVISSNAPLDAQNIIAAEARRHGAKFIFWLQDIYSEAIATVLSARLGVLGQVVGARYRALEYRLLRRSDHVVAICSAFADTLVGNGVPAGRISVIENWAPIEDMPRLARQNAWANTHMPHRGLRVVYSGTLGHKHNPEVLLEVAGSIDGHVYVFSEGSVAGQLAEQARDAGIENLSVHGWVPFQNLPEMLAGADILVALLEPSAGSFSVPSKVLSYLCAGRPIAAAIPRGNLARQIIRREAAGLVSDPGDHQALLRNVRDLATDAAKRRRMGGNGRRYAERAFAIESITDSFEIVLDRVAGPHQKRA